ncbi:MAG: class F sortase [Propionibacteriaceae bacterium]|nr:class F sortase [Propionibacteriaceae bacterium]
MTSSPRAPTTVSVAKTRASVAKARRPTPAKRDLRPARIRIPALRVDRGPVPLRVLEDGSLEAPPRYVDVGWWQDGPLPGAAGNTVVVGHLDSKTGPAVFYGLAALRWGDEVTVTRRDASTVHYRVRSVQRFPAKDFPATRVYRRDGPPGLALITCGGQYDRTAGRYLDNVVVFADRAR